MSTFQFVHDRLSLSVLLFMLALGLWGLWTYLRGEEVSGSLWGAMAIGEILIVVEGLLGAGLFLGGHRPARTALHLLYGLFMAGGVPRAASFSPARSFFPPALVFF